MKLLISLRKHRPAGVTITLNGLLLAAVFSLLLFAPNAAAQKASKTREPASAAPAKRVRQYTIEQFMDTVRLGGGSFSFDEKHILFHNNKTGIFNVYTVPVAGGEAKQLTNSTKESTFAVSYLPNDSRFIYSYDRGGNENSHLYLREQDDTERDLTPGEKTKANFLTWAHDRKSFFYSTNERDPKYFDVFEMTVADMKATLVFKDETGYEFADISNDKRYLAFSKPGDSTIDSDIFLYDAQQKEMKKITPHTGEVSFNAQSFDPQSKNLYFTTDEGSEFAYLKRYELSTGNSVVVEKAPWDIWGTYFSRNGKYRVTIINQDARTVIKIYDAASGKLVPLPQLPGGDITGVTFAPSESRMAFYLNGDRAPANLYVYDFATRKATKLTNSLNPEINANDLVEAENIRYKSFDGMEVPAILYKPHEASSANKVPALVLVHGGPGGQARRGYKAQVQFLVNHGYAVLDVNNRGSSGYGKTFFTADDRKHGREPLWDVVEAKKYLQSTGWVDEQKIGVMGGSYGGYMVLAALAFKPEEFAVGVDIFGVSNWVRTLQSIPPYWESFRKSLYKEIGHPNTELEMLKASSPLFHADKIRRPLIVLQGANDPRVIKPESDEIVEAAKKSGVPVEYVVFDNEGHGFTKKANEIRANKAILDFLDKHLRGK
ncbi:MAG TPA: prolyl oligopeptidase family serine peptidase [Pyrinomonadaceae bacterium]|nr:prolyl oligopeptidase family serine peptidase [Pyrinomonadaceae bacterium]